jgi:trk system potassium uptake protein
MALLVWGWAALSADPAAPGFLACGLLSLFMGGVFALIGKGGRPDMGFRQAVAVTAGAWLGLPVLAAIPFLFPPVSLSFVDAVFESVSGITTTGSTVMSGLDEMPRAILLWRSLLQWVGGIGIIGMSIAILPFLRVGGMQLFRLESSDRSEDRLVTRASEVAMAVGGIYLMLTGACAISYGMAGMSQFDAVAHAMTTVATGGYSTSDSSMAAFPAAAQWIAIIFMMSGAVPFLAYVALMRGKGVRGPGSYSEIRVFLLVVILAAMAMTAVQTAQGTGDLEALRLALFNVTSVVTTTGYAVGDYQLWGPSAVTLFFVLTFLGGCAGSTSGGFKAFRLEIMSKAVWKTLAQLPSPHSIVTARHNGKRLEDEDIASVAMFACLYVAVFALGAVAFGFLGLDMLTAVSSSATAIANGGPGLGEIVGPAGNFTTLPETAKWAMCVMMVLGRLEIVVILLLLTPRFYDA